MLYRMVELDDGVEVQYLAVGALRWRPEWGEPEVGFVEVETDGRMYLAELKGKYDQLLEEHKALQELLAARDDEIEGLRADLRRERAAYEGLQVRLRAEMEKCRESEVKLWRAHRMLVDDLNALWPDGDAPGETLKAKLLRDVQEYCDGPL